MTTKPPDIDAYLAGVPEAARATLEQVRRAIKAIAPEAVESISYAMPAFKYQGRPLVYFGAAKNHCALYGILTDAHADDLAGYDTSKGAIRFPFGRPPPETLLRKLLSARMAAIEAAATRKRPRRGAMAQA